MANRNKPMRGYSLVGLQAPKNNANVGSVLRAARLFDCRGVFITGVRCNIRRLTTDTQRAYRHVPVKMVDNLLDHVPEDCKVVAVELVDDAHDLVTFVHPERAMYVFGPEDSSLGKAILAHCYATVKIPTIHCLNLAATANIVLYDRLAKGTRKREWFA